MLKIIRVKIEAEHRVAETFLFFLSRYFLSRFLALSNIDDDEVINDEIFKNVSNNEIIENDDEVIKTLRD